MKNTNSHNSLAAPRMTGKSAAQPLASTRAASKNATSSQAAPVLKVAHDAAKLSNAKPLITPQNNGARAKKTSPENAPAIITSEQEKTVAKTQRATISAAPSRVAQIENAQSTKTKMPVARVTEKQRIPEKPLAKIGVASAKTGKTPPMKAEAATTKISIAKTCEASPARGGQVKKSAVEAATSTARAAGSSSEKTPRAATAQSSDAATIKAKRAKLPADFAAQYTRDSKKKPAPAAVATPPKKRARRSAAERENLRRALQPDDDFLRRLARIGVISSNTDMPPMRAQSAPRRSRKWESRCGKCGTNATFSTPASLCARCGTIVVRAE